MKQLIQHLDTGHTELFDTPAPVLEKHQLLIASRLSLVSPGTERMIVQFGRQGWAGKARSQPERVRQVIDKLRTDGVAPTIAAVRTKLRTPLSLGYCNVGTVLEVGARVNGFKPGDRVVSNGPHAEIVRVPWTLAALVPEGVSDEAAAFTPIASVALQGIRLAAPTLGENVVVYGLGLIGQLAVQLLRSSGCNVIGIDRDPARARRAAQEGATIIDPSNDLAEEVVAVTGGVGADAVLLTLASRSDEPIRWSAEMCRRNGRIVLVGVTGLHIPRDPFYRKELSFRVSCSYGPGRYDRAYEQDGADYPVGFVRWTARRNFAAVLRLMEQWQLDPGSLITHRLDFAQAVRAYGEFLDQRDALGILIHYDEANRSAPPARKIQLSERAVRRGPHRPVVAVIGAGNFAARTLLPALHARNVRLHTLVASNGTSAGLLGRQFGFEQASSDVGDVFDNPDIETVFVLTRHDSHAQLAQRALLSRKHVFVEKPLALTHNELGALRNTLASAETLLTVGFNRRFAPLALRMRAQLARRAAPVSLIITVNAGRVPRDHWTVDAVTGGGRILGEACHFIDLARFLVGASIKAAHAVNACDRTGAPIADLAQITLSFADGSFASLHYLPNGSARFPKERIEAFCEGRTLAIDNWRRLIDYDAALLRFNPRRNPQKGHAQELAAWFDALESTGIPPIPYEELLEVSEWAMRVAGIPENLPS